MKKVCFVTGTRAEFGLMRSTLEAIRKHPELQLQVIATGMHLSAEHGETWKEIGRQGFALDAKIPWKAGDLAVATAAAAARLPVVWDRLGTDIVLVVGDRVEAFAAATAGHLTGRAVAHVHGGDRALGQVDDALRHAITKLSHVHFPATVHSRQRLIKLGEDRWRVHRAGSPGIDDIVEQAVSTATLMDRFAGLRGCRFALLVLHPTDTGSEAEYQHARLLLKACRKVGFDQLLIVYPNNDPGSDGIIRCWKEHAGSAIVCPDVPRPYFLASLREAALLVGNSSSGIIEAASFGTPVLDVGARQLGREHGENVSHAGFDTLQIEQQLRRMWNGGQPRRFPRQNIYGHGKTGQKIAAVLAELKIDAKLLRKLIAY